MSEAEIQNEQPKLLLDDALELLNDVRNKLGMFEHQRYQQIKSKIDNSNVFNQDNISN